MRLLLCLLITLVLAGCETAGSTRVKASVDQATGAPLVEIEDSKDRGGLEAEYKRTSTGEIGFKIKETDINGSTAQAQAQAAQAQTMDRIAGMLDKLYGLLMPAGAAAKIVPK